MSQGTLFVQPTVHCFLASCDHTVTDEPQAAHDRMEEHYDEKHGELIARLAGKVGGWR